VTLICRKFKIIWSRLQKHNVHTKFDENPFTALVQTSRPMTVLQRFVCDVGTAPTQPALTSVTLVPTTVRN
jgi:hypothetical protein